MPAFQLDFEVYCTCGNGLCSQSRVSTIRGYSQVEVTPCKICLEKAKDEGYNDGYDQGWENYKSDEGANEKSGTGTQWGAEHGGEDTHSKEVGE
jgi:hypothetical protein